jgi:hypothetical protein
LARRQKGMHERLASVNWTPHDPNHLRANDQVPQQSTWVRVPERQRTNAAIHTITQVPKNGSTCTYVNPMDPANDGWAQNPNQDWGAVHPAGNWRRF